MLFQIWSVFYDCASWNRRGNQEKAIHMFLKHNLVYNVQPFRMYHFSQVLQLWGANCLSFFRNRSCLQFLGRGLLHPSKADLPRSSIWLEGLKKGTQGVCDRSDEARQETQSTSKTYAHCGIGRHERWRRTFEKCMPLEGSLGHPAHLHTRGNAQHFQRISKAR